MKHIAITFAALSTVAACADDPSPIVGDSCASNAECTSGVCFEQRCLAPDGAACDADADCATARCVANLCGGVATPETTTFFVFGPRIGVEDNAGGGLFVPALSYSETLTITRAGITVGAECTTDAFLRSADGENSPIRTTVRCRDDAGAEPFPYDSGPASMTVVSEPESFTNEFGFTETAEAYTTNIIATGPASGHPADADVLIGQGLRSYVISDTNGSATRGREIDGVVAIRRSTNLKPSALEGDWGFVTLGVEASAGGPQAEYSSGYFSATASPGAGGMTLVPTSSGGLSVRQELTGANGQPIEVSRTSGDVDEGVPFAIAASGAVEVGGTEILFSGAADPRGDFMMLANTDPVVWPPFSGAGPLDEPSAAQTFFLFAWGVKRAADEIATLAGKRYRFVRFAIRAEAGRFVVLYDVDSPTLAFDETATAATFTASESEFAVSFAGGLFPKKSAVNLPALVVSAGRASSFALSKDGAPEPLVNGYVSADGRVIIFSDTTAILNAVEAPLSATVGISFGVCTNCDAPAAN